MSHAFQGHNGWLQGPRHAVAAVILLAVAGCGGDDHCWDCGGSSPPAPATEASAGLIAGNFTGNGHTTVVATSTILYNAGANAGNLKIYPSTGPGTYGAPVLVSDGYDPLYLASADLNGDHLPDVVSASFDDGALRVFLNSTQAPGTFGSPLVLPSPGASQVAIADMNGDGLPDLISADYNVSLFLQTAPGVFGAPVPLYQGGANWVAVGDLNGDGMPDVALTDSVGVKVLLHQGAASATTYAAPVSVFTSTPNASTSAANVIAIADVNGDGFNDIVVTDPGPTGGSAPTVVVILQDATHPGQFLAPTTYSTAQGGYAQSIVVADVNGDGHLDIVVGGTQGVTVLLQNPSSLGTFTSTSYPVPFANEIAVADANGDGLPDIIVSSGATQPVVNGVVTNTPGVLLQVASAPGTFSALQNLP
jgi:hypothetical protein